MAAPVGGAAAVAAAPTGGAGTGTAAAAGAAAAAPSLLDQYEVISAIGKGSFGTVSRIRRKADGRMLVWKELNYGTMREKEKQLVVSEVNILRELRHPFIVRYYDRIIDKASTKIYIVMECCEGGDLGNVVKACKRDGTSVDEEFVWKVFTQLVMALKECHRHKDATGKVAPILHRDIKPGNVFMDAAQNVKLGDFGLAKELTSESKFASTNVGTPFYMSPEMINEVCYNEKSDIWALGCLLYELCALAPPFDATNHLSLAVKINAGKFNRIPAQYSEDLHRAIRWMLSLESAKRPCVEELEKLPRIKALSREASLVVREYTTNHTYTARMRELKVKEEELARREAALAAGERSLREREAALAARATEVQRREAALAARAGSLADDESRRYSMGDRLRPGSAGGSAAAAPGASGVPLHRAHSMGDMPVHHGAGMMAATGTVPTAAGASATASSAAGVPDLRRARSFSSHGTGMPTGSMTPSDATVIPVSVGRPSSAGGSSVGSFGSLPTPLSTGMGAAAAYGFQPSPTPLGSMHGDASGFVASGGDDTEMAGTPGAAAAAAPRVAAPLVRRASMGAAPLGALPSGASNGTAMPPTHGVKTMMMPPSAGVPAQRVPWAAPGGVSTGLGGGM